jgi:uncharacterized protein (DUF3084 family)
LVLDGTIITMATTMVITTTGTVIIRITTTTIIIIPITIIILKGIHPQITQRKTTLEIIQDQHREVDQDGRTHQLIHPVMYQQM